MAMMIRIFAMALMLVMPLSYAAEKKLDWNDAALTWHRYDAGIAKMKQVQAKGLVILYADWCPTCKRYSTLFASEKVVAALDGLVLIRENIDHASGADWLVNYDAGYVPKTIALTSQGKLSPALYPDKQEYMFFFNPKDGEDKLLELIKQIKSSS